MANTLKFGNGTWATKKGSTLAYNDENNNYKPLPFNFERNSIATRVNKEGLIEVVGNNIPRIDYKDDSNGALLLEPSRSNLITYSEDFTQWSLAGGSSISSNQSISPNGTLNADNVSSGEVYVNGLGISGNTYTFSCYYKGNAGETFIQNVYDGSNHNRFTRTFNGKWQRFSITVTLTNSGIFYLVDDRTGGNSSSFSVWGAQLEEGSYATSYIPTQGSAATRVGESCNNSGNSEVFNDSEGVLMAEVNFNEEQTTSRYISINDGGSSDRVLFGVTSNTSNLKGFVYQNNQTPYLINTDININYVQKIALLYKTNLIQLYLNGFKIDEITTAVMPTGLNKLSFNDSVTADFYGKTKQISYYDTALTDAELEYITSYRSLNELVTELNLNEL